MLLTAYCTLFYYLRSSKNFISTTFCLIGTLVFTLTSIKTQAQSFLGYHSTSYAGVYGTLYNPANILDGRTNSDINLLGFSAGFQNNAFSITPAGTDMPNPITKTGAGAFQADILGPSFMKKLSDEHAFAITTRGRAQANFDNFSNYLLNIALQTDKSYVDKQQVLGKNASAQLHTWNELAFTYSRQIANTDFGVWKAAVSVKLLGGQGAAYLKSNNFSFTYRDTMKIDSVKRIIYNGGENFQGNLNWQYSSIWDGGQYSFFRQPGFGLDVGFTYEFRDEMQVYETNYNENTLNYKWKFGVSIMDIGSINYKTSPNSLTASFKGQSYLFDSISVPNDSTKIPQITNFYKSVFPSSNMPPTDLRMSLPTTLHLMFDYSFNEWLSTEAHLSLPLLFDKTSYVGTYNPALFSVTPRAELSWAGVYAPVSYNFLSGFQMGAAFRIGPLVVGSGSILSFGGLGKSKSLDAYMILRVPFFKYKPYEKEFNPRKSHLTKSQRMALDCPELK